MWLLTPLLSLTCAFIFALAPACLVAKEKDKFPAMHHLVKIKPSQAVRIPDAFPLSSDGLLVCKTCHGIKDIEDLPFDKVNKKDKDFFRNGPYSKLSDFCYRCHTRKAYPRLNVHKLLDKSGNIKKKQCLHCHEKTLDLKKPINYQDIKFRAPIEKLCYGCHLDTPHLNAVNHQKKPEKEMLERIKQYEQKHNIIFPLDLEGKVMCTTCHNPHQKGLLPDDRPASHQVADTDLDTGITYYDQHDWENVYQEDKQSRLKEFNRQLDSTTNIQLHYKRIKTEVLLRLPAKDGTLCMVCHKFES